MNSQRFLGLLEQDGFDRATAETVVKLAEAKPIAEARELLIGMLGENNSHVESYLTNRRHAEINQQRAMASQPQIKTVKSRKAKQTRAGSSPEDARASSPHSIYTNAEKIDSVKDIDAAMEKLSVNPPGRKECDCMGSKHGLLDMAPNCLNCGKIVCKKEGLGPCLHCNEPLLPNDKVKEITEILTKQKYAVIATMNKKALVAAGIDPSIKQDMHAMSESSAVAETNLERLLGYQANDSVRTRIIDQVGEVDMPYQGVSQWSTASEQAEQLRQQQKALRRAEAERKMRSGQGKKVLSIDVRGNKVYQSIVDAPIEEQLDDEEDEEGLEPKEPQELIDADFELAKPVHYYDSKTAAAYQTPLYTPDSEQGTSHASQKNKNSSLEMAEVIIHRDTDEEYLY